MQRTVRTRRVACNFCGFRSAFYPKIGGNFAGGRAQLVASLQRRGIQLSRVQTACHARGAAILLPRVWLVQQISNQSHSESGGKWASVGSGLFLIQLTSIIKYILGR